METNDIIRQKGSGPHVHVTLCHLSYLSRFLCSAVEDFVVDIVRPGPDKAEQYSNRVCHFESKFPSVLYSLWHQGPNF